MRQRLCLLAILLGLLLRVASAGWHEHARGDVLLDVGVARSLAHGEGFHAGFVRGTALVQGDGPPPPQDLADQHPPLWPVVGAALAAVTGSPFAGLKLGSLLAGALLIVLVWRQTDRLVEGCVGARDGLPALAAALTALSFPMIDASGNGSLYMAQACGVVALAGTLGAARPSALRLGLLLGLLWLLNYQAAVLLPVPLLVLLAAARAGERRAALVTGLLAVAVAVLAQVPWWWRNAVVFGDPFHNVNGLYPLLKAGLEPRLAIEGGVPIARMPEASLAAALFQGLRLWVPANVLYLLTTGIVLWPGLAGVVAAGVLPLAGQARRGRDRRLAAVLLCLAFLTGVALLWPDMKLRYAVPLTPLVILLGMRLIAAPPTRAERRLALLVAAAWALAVLATLGDLSGPEATRRVDRWRLLLLGGAVLFVLPLALRHARGPAQQQVPRAGLRPGLRLGRRLRLLLVTGAAAVPLVTALALAPWPHTAYHSTRLTPDVFGQAQKEIDDERLAITAELGRQRALEDGAARLAGPIELLQHDGPALVLEPMGSGTPAGDAALAALVDKGLVDHVFVYGRRGWPEGLAAGDTWLDGRLIVVAVWSPGDPQQARAGAFLSRVRR